MYCSTEKANASNIYRSATILFPFLIKKKINKCVPVSSHILLNFSGSKNEATTFFSSLTQLSSQSWSLRSKGVAFWEEVGA